MRVCAVFSWHRHALNGGIYTGERDETSRTKKQAGIGTDDVSCTYGGAVFRSSYGGAA